VAGVRDGQDLAEPGPHLRTIFRRFLPHLRAAELGVTHPRLTGEPRHRPAGSRLEANALRSRAVIGTRRFPGTEARAMADPVKVTPTSTEFSSRTSGCACCRCVRGLVTVPRCTRIPHIWSTV
jgi:hypothetical protein